MMLFSRWSIREGLGCDETFQRALGDTPPKTLQRVGGGSITRRKGGMKSTFGRDGGEREGRKIYCPGGGIWKKWDTDSTLFCI